MLRKGIFAFLAAAALAVLGALYYVYSDRYFTQRFDAAVDEIVQFGDEVKAKFPSNSAAEHVRKTMSAVGEELKRYNKELNLEKLTRRERVEKLQERFLESISSYQLSLENLPAHIKMEELEELESHMNQIKLPEKLLKMLDMPTGSIEASPPKEGFIERALEKIGFD